LEKLNQYYLQLLDTSELAAIRKRSVIYSASKDELTKLMLTLVMVLASPFIPSGRRYYNPPQSWQEYSNKLFPALMALMVLGLIFLVFDYWLPTLAMQKGSNMQVISKSKARLLC
jgi:hypothetical protein